MPVAGLAAIDTQAGVPQAEASPVQLRLRGPLTASTARALRHAIAVRATAGAQPLLIDLEAVTAIDASGIAALLEGQRVMADAAAGLFLRTGPRVTWALKRSGTIRAFRMWTAPVPPSAAPIDVP